MAKDSLEYLFGSKVRVELLRLFILNPETIFDSKSAAQRLRGNGKAVRSHLLALLNSGFVKKVIKKKDQPGGFILSSSFPFLKPFQDLLGGGAYEVRESLAKKFSRTGNIRLVVLSGSFMEPSVATEVDVLIVGNSIKKNTIGAVIEWAELQLGRELSFALLDEADFEYRMQMYDKFVRSIFESPHEFLIDKLHRQGT